MCNLGGIDSLLFLTGLVLVTGGGEWEVALVPLRELPLVPLEDNDFVRVGLEDGWATPTERCPNASPNVVGTIDSVLRSALMTCNDVMACDTIVWEVTTPI